MQNAEGYRNLLSILWEARLTVDRRQAPPLPVLNLSELAARSAGLVILSGSYDGEIRTLARSGLITTAVETVRRYNNLFGQGRFYLELVPVGKNEPPHINRGLVRIAEEVRVPVVAAADPRADGERADGGRVVLPSAEEMQ